MASSPNAEAQSLSVAAAWPGNCRSSAWNCSSASWSNAACRVRRRRRFAEEVLRQQLHIGQPIGLQLFQQARASFRSGSACSADPNSTWTNAYPEKWFRATVSAKTPAGIAIHLPSESAPWQEIPFARQDARPPSQHPISHVFSPKLGPFLRFLPTRPLTVPAEAAKRVIGIGAAVARRPLPHHRAYGSVHGGSIGYVSTPRTTMEVRAI